MPPTPQPTDDVDIYFETPADDKEHSRFQRAKEQLEIRHRNRMERVSYRVLSGRQSLIKEAVSRVFTAQSQNMTVIYIICGIDQYLYIKGF